MSQQPLTQQMTRVWTDMSSQAGAVLTAPASAADAQPSANGSDVDFRAHDDSGTNHAVDPRQGVADEISGIQGRIVSTKFLLTVLLLTGLFFGIFIPYLNNVWAWIVLAISIVPVYSIIYSRVLYLKGWYLHRRELFSPTYTEPEVKTFPELAFIIAAYNEPFDVAKMTFDCAYNARYTGAREIVVVDNTKDSGRDDFQMWKMYVESHIDLDPRIRVEFHHDTAEAGSKARNMDLAQALIKRAEYVVFLDIDSSLPLDVEFLDIAVAKFESDAKLGILQFHSVPTNGHFNRLSRAVALAQLGHRTRELIRSSGGFATFYGHNAMWRRSLLELNGSWLEHYRGNLMVTEDLLKTLAIHTKGYKSRYMNVPTGEWVPASLSSLNSMWMRWTYGGFQVLSKYFRAIVSAKGLTTTQRIDLVTLIGSYAATPLIFPVAFLWFAVFPPALVAMMTFLIIFLPPLLYAGLYWHLNNSAVRYPLAQRVWDLYSGLFVIESYVFMVQIRAVVNFIAGKKQGWRVTVKSGEEKPRGREVLLNNRYMVTLSVLAIATLLAAWGWQSGFDANVLKYHLVVALIPINLLLCVLVYGGQVQCPNASAEDATIDRVTMGDRSSDAEPTRTAMTRYIDEYDPVIACR
jgi:cellulose synthase/poly-beta-1,6-N-acetylglucosamine synthase-like glycosyltransferase